MIVVAASRHSFSFFFGVQGPRMKETFALNGNLGNNRCDSFDLLEYLSKWFSNPGVYEHDKVCREREPQWFSLKSCMHTDMYMEKA